MGFEGNQKAHVVGTPGEGVSHKARTRRKNRELAEEAEANLQKALDKPGKFGGGKHGDSRLRQFIAKAGGSAEADFDWLHCMMYPSESTKARMPDLETTVPTSINFFENTGTITVDTLGGASVTVVPGMTGFMKVSNLGGTGAVSDLGIGSAAGGAYRTYTQMADYANVVAAYRTTAYAATLRFLGNLTTTQGQFAICQGYPGFAPTTFAQVVAMPGSRYGTIPELFGEGAFHFFGTFDSVNAGSHASSSAADDKPWSMIDFNQVGQTSYSTIAGGGFYLPNICIALSGMTAGASEISIATQVVVEGRPLSTIVPTARTCGSAVGMAAAKLASHPALRDAHIGVQSHHSGADGGGIASSLIKGGKSLGKWVYNNFDKIEGIGSEVLSAAGKAAGVLGPLAMMLL